MLDWGKNLKQINLATKFKDEEKHKDYRELRWIVTKLKVEVILSL
jgi:hypothetical protein